MNPEFSALKMSISLDARVLPAVSFAMQQNGVSLLGPIAIENRSDEPLEQLELQIDASPAFALPFSRHIDLIPAGQTVTLTRPGVLLDASFLASLTENPAFSEALGDRTLLVQGSIDLLCIFPDGHMEICDYKTDHITSDERSDPSLLQARMREEHGEQLAQYVEAVKEMYGVRTMRVSVFSLPLGEALDMNI